MLRSATSQTSPPDPPSPPSGPPMGTWASRRIETQPAPPSPPRAHNATSSTNWDTTQGYGLAALSPEGDTAVAPERGGHLDVSGHPYHGPMGTNDPATSRRA